MDAIRDALPCPFCGHVGLDFNEGSSFRWLAYSCAGCGMGSETRVQTMGDGTPEQWSAQARVDAVAEWNTRAQPAASGEAPSVETLLAQARELARVTAERPGQAVAIPELLSTEGRKFMRGEPSLFDRAPLGDLQEVGGAMSACPHDVPHRWPCAECDAAPTPVAPEPAPYAHAEFKPASFSQFLAANYGPPAPPLESELRAPQPKEPT